MQAIGGPVRELMRDVKAVQWLALEEAIEQFTHVREQVFLEHVGPIAVRAAERSARRNTERPARKSTDERARSSILPGVVEQPAPHEAAALLSADAALIAGPHTVAHAELLEREIDAFTDLAPFAAAGTESMATATLPAHTGNDGQTGPAANQNVLEKTWVWFRQAALSNRLRGD